MSSSPMLTPCQKAALIYALEEAKSAHTPARAAFYRGILCGLQRAIDIVSHSTQPLNQAGRCDV